MGISPTPQITPTVKAVAIDQQIGSLAPTYMSAQVEQGATWDIKGTCTYEDMCYLMQSAYGAPTITATGTKTITGNTQASPTVVTATAHGFITGQLVTITGSNSTPSINGTYAITRLTANTFSIPVSVTVAGTAGSAVSATMWQYASPTTQVWNPLSLSMQLGDLVNPGVGLSGCLNQTWNITATQQKELTFTATGFGQTFSASQSLTAALNYRTVHPILMAQALFYADAAGAAPGTTAIANTLYSYQVDGDTGLKPIYGAGNLGPIDFSYDKQTLKVKLGLFYSPTLQTFFQTNWLTGLPVVTRFQATAGALQFTHDFAGFVTSDPAVWGDSQSARVLEVELEAQVDSTSSLANYSAFTLQNAVATLP
jgi:hypothetical protein